MHKLLKVLSIAIIVLLVSLLLIVSGGYVFVRRSFPPAMEYHPMHFDKASIEADREGVLILTP